MTLLLIILVIIFLGGSGWGYSRYPGSGPYLGGGLGIVVLVIVLWLIFSGGRL